MAKSIQRHSLLLVYIKKRKRGKEEMSVISSIKEEAKKAGQSKGKFIYFQEGVKKRIRFLTEFDEGMEIIFHDSFEEKINVPCQEIYGLECPYCEMDNLRTRKLFIWSVWDYDAKEVKLLMQAVNNCTAIPAIMALYEDYGSLLDRDLVITKTGKQQNTTYAVVPQDKNTFKNTKAKPYSENAILKFLEKAYPADNADGNEDYEHERPKRNAKEKARSKAAQEDWDDDGSDINYEEMSAKELYKLCGKKGIEVLPKKPERYYIKKLEEFEQAQEDWDDDDEEDEWEDE